MSVNMQTLHDVLIAIVTTVGIAVAVSLAIVAAGSLYKRDQARKSAARGPATAPAQHPTKSDSDLVLR